MNIPLGLIAIIDRDRKDMGDIAALANDIKENTQLTPGIVRHAVEEDRERWEIDPEDTPFVLVAGERRFRACALAGLDTFLCENRGDLPILQQKIYELAENLHRKDLTWDEEALMRKKIHEILSEQAKTEDRSWSQKDTARYLGESTATISRDIEVARAIELEPTLKVAGSKKAVARVLEMREHLQRKELQAEGTARAAGKIQSLLLTADARDAIRQQPAGSVDLLLTDFPYALGIDNLYKASKGAARPVSEYDDSDAVTSDLYYDIVPEIIRVTKSTGWICTTISESNYEGLRELFETCCTTHLQYGSVFWQQDDGGDWVRILPTSCPGWGEDSSCSFLRAEVPRWIWFRPNSQNPTRVPELHAKNFYEPLLVLNRGEAKLYKHQDDCPNVLVYEAEYGGERYHIMQKPRALARELVQRFTLPGELVYDPFFGSGNLLAGAAELHRKIKGTEKNPLMLDTALVNVGRYYGG